jgi:hypothetical protein
MTGERCEHSAGQRTKDTMCSIAQKGKLNNE